MYHQIRKMVGAIIFAMRHKLDQTFINNTFHRNVVPIWLAPSEGLLLNRIFFDGYNKKSFIPEKIQLGLQAHKSYLAFLNRVIYPHVADKITSQPIFDSWLKQINFYENG